MSSYEDKMFIKLNIQVMDMGVSNYSIILGRDWQVLTGGYLYMDGTHMIIPKGPNNIIVNREGSDKITYASQAPSINWDGAARYALNNPALPFNLPSL